MFQESEFEELRQHLESQFEDDFNINDRAHRQDHIRQVCFDALDINTNYQLGLDRRMIVISAYCHDLFSRFRKNHHQLAYHFVKTADYPWLRIFSEEEKEQMAHACLEHRASWKGDYYSLLSELIATADRGAPKNLDAVLERSRQFALSFEKKSEKAALEHSINHIYEKFGSKGYAKYPNLYHIVYGKQLSTFQAEVDLLVHTPSQLALTRREIGLPDHDDPQK